MRFIKYAAPILAAVLCSLWSCDKDESTLSKAVLASTGTLNFAGQGASPQIITVYADGDWVAEVPDWVTVEPASGSGGATDVTISVSENMRTGALDNPRKANVVFKGRSIASRAPVLITQAGDKFRDVGEYNPGDIAGLPNEKVVSMPNLIVMAVTTAGFVATDAENTANIYVLSTATVAVGDKISIMGDKGTAQSLPFVNADILTPVSTGNTVTYPTPEDITDKVDTYTKDSREFIEVSGILGGNSISIADATFSVSIKDAPASMGIAALNGHRVTVRGYFAGVAAPVISIMAAEIDDNGPARTTFFFEDFEWLEPWSVAGDAGRTVETDNLSANAPQIVTPKVTIEGTDVSANDALLAKGYSFLRVTQTSDNATECIYLQRNYLKFGKTGYQAGIILPKIEDVPAGVNLTMTFVWCPMRQGSGVFDPVNMLVVFKNGSDEVTFELTSSRDYFAESEKLRWVKEEIALTGVTITEDTQITIKQTNWKLGTANRWFLDNVEIYTTDEI